MVLELLKTVGNRVATEEEAVALQEQLEEENALVGLLKRGQEIQIARLQTEERIVKALRRSRSSTESLLEATNKLFILIEQLQVTFNSGLPDQEDPDVISRLPTTEEYVSRWRFAFEALTGISDLILQRKRDAQEREITNEAQLQLHESLCAHAAQAVEHVEASIHSLRQSVDDKRLGVLHPMRRLSVEMFSEIFRYAVDEEYNDLMEQLSSANVPAQNHLPTVAFTIAATCRHWREVTTAMPELWRYICAPWSAFVTLNGCSVPAVVGRARFDRCLALAGDTDLELTVRGGRLPCWEPILGNDRARKWTWINILDPPNIPALFPSAPNIWLCSTNGLDLNINLPTTLLSSTSYLLCTSYIPCVTMPIPGLRELDIWLSSTYVTCPDLGALLISLPTLKKLTLDCDNNCKFKWVENRVVRSHQSPRSLTIMPSFAPYLTFELRYLSLPFLKELNILDVDTFLNTGQISCLLGSPVSISSTVKSLSVRSTGLVVRSEDIRTLIDGLPKLTSLSLEESAVAPGLEALMDTKVPDKLKKIILSGYEEEEMVNELIERLRFEYPRLPIETEIWK